MKLKDLAVKYSLEFLVIVLGISVSFWLNQIATERVEEQERIKVLQSLHAELERLTSTASSAKTITETTSTFWMPCLKRALIRTALKD